MHFQVYEEIGEGLDELDMNGRKVNMRAYCSWFNFAGADQQKKVASLSGGERNRLQLAKACGFFLVCITLTAQHSRMQGTLNKVWRFSQCLLGFTCWCCAGPEKDWQCPIVGKGSRMTADSAIIQYYHQLSSHFQACKFIVGSTET